MGMTYFHDCAGINACGPAWKALDWQCKGFTEIEPFPCALLKHYHPDIPNYGDTTEFKPRFTVNLLIGGTPCQDFSVAGNRAGLDGERSGLARNFFRLADSLQPCWIVWENVPGVLSSNEGRDFHAILMELDKRGYGYAWRILNAQYFGVPQRRRRVFLVGYSGDWRPAAAVLFEQESLRGYPSPSQETREGLAASLRASSSPRGHGNSHGLRGDGQDNIITHPLDTQHGVTEDGGGRGVPIVAGTLKSCGGKSGTPNGAEEADRLIVTDMRGNGDGEIVNTLSGDHASRPTDYTPIVFQKGNPHDTTYEADSSSILSTLRRKVGKKSVAEWGFRMLDSLQSEKILQSWMYGESIRESSQAFKRWVDGCPFESEKSEAGRLLRIVWENGPDGRTPQGRGLVKQLAGEFTASLPIMSLEGTQTESELHDLSATRERIGILQQALSSIQKTWRPQSDEGESEHRSLIRRLTPLEACRLQGFPDDYTLIPYRGKPACDGVRYKSLGNSIAVPVLRWIGKRIQMVEELL